MTIKKKLLIMRHGPSFEVGPYRVCSPFGRIKLAKSARRLLDPGPISIVAAPDWDTRYTAICVAEAFEATEPVFEPSLSKDHDGPVSDEFARKLLADPNPDIIITHYKRLDSVLAAIENAADVKLEIEEARMRHLNRAYLVDMEKGHVLVIKERS